MLEIVLETCLTTLRPPVQHVSTKILREGFEPPLWESESQVIATTLAEEGMLHQERTTNSYTNVIKTAHAHREPYPPRTRRKPASAIASDSAGSPIHPPFKPKSLPLEMWRGATRVTCPLSMALADVES